MSIVLRTKGKYKGKQLVLLKIWPNYAGNLPALV